MIAGPSELPPLREVTESQSSYRVDGPIPVRATDLLDDDVLSVSDTVPSNDVGDAAPSMPASHLDSGYVDLSAASAVVQNIEPTDAPPAPRPRAVEDTQVKDLRATLLQEFLELHAKNHYALLGVVPDAQPDEIASAYKMRRERLSPESFGARDLATETEKLGLVHSAYDRAFFVLSDPKKRQAYDTELGLSGSVKPMPPKRVSPGSPNNNSAYENNARHPEDKTQPTLQQGHVSKVISGQHVRGGQRLHGRVS